MANKLFGTKLCATALAAFALASCQSENTLLESAADGMRDVTLTVTASKGDLTRTNLELSEDQKALLLSWNLGDEIQVAEEDGRYAGVLKVTEFVDDAHTQAKFEGKVRMLDNDGDHKLSFFYLGKDATYSARSGKDMPDMVYDLTSQRNAGVAALAANDLLYDQTDVTVSKGNATFKSLYMARQFAYGRFTLLYNDQPLQFGENTVVTINTELGDIKTGATIDFPSDINADANGSISVTTSENDFYVTFVPGSSEGKFKFNVTINGQEYEGYSNSYLVEKNDFYRKAQGLTVGEALPINVKKTDGSDDEHSFTLTYNANFGEKETWSDPQTGVGFTYTYTLAEYTSIFNNTREGYTFLGWTEDEDGKGDVMLPNSTLTVNYNESKTVYAKWDKDYSISFKKYPENYKVNNQVVQEDYVYADLDLSDPANVVLPDDPNPEKEWVFLGWKEAGSNDNTATKDPWTLTEEKSDVTLVPVYKKYDWIFRWIDDPADNVGDGFYGAVRNSGYGPTHTLLDAFPCDNPNSKDYYQSNVKEGYTFSHWEYNGEIVKKAADVTAPVGEYDPKYNAIYVPIYAKWIKNPTDYYIIYEDNEGVQLKEYTFPSKLDEITVNVNNNAPSVTVPAGSEFKGWAIKGTTEVKTSVTLYKGTPSVTVVPVIEKKDSTGVIVAPGAGGSDY